MAALTVVHADDNPDMRLLLTLNLDKGGPVEIVGEATTGKDAVELVERLRPDVLITDHHMPEMSGAEAISLCKQSIPELDVIAFSGSSGMGSVQELIDAGARLHIDKSNIGDLVRELHRLAETHRTANA